MDHRDRLILALSALLRAERQTRDAFDACIAAGVLEPETLRAIISDPIPIVTHEDLNYAERLDTGSAHVGGHA